MPISMSQAVYFESDLDDKLVWLWTFKGMNRICTCYFILQSMLSLQRMNVGFEGLWIRLQMTKWFMSFCSVQVIHASFRIENQSRAGRKLQHRKSWKCAALVTPIQAHCHFGGWNRGCEGLQLTQTQHTEELLLYLFRWDQELIKVFIKPRNVQKVFPPSEEAASLHGKFQVEPTFQPLENQIYPIQKSESWKSALTSKRIVASS